MEKFNVYIESDGFVWTRGRIILSLIFSIFLLTGTEYLLFGDLEINSFKKILFILLIFLFLLGAINQCLNEQLKGKLSGKIVFSNQKIQIADRTFILEEIRLIKFSCNDYVDELIRNNFPNGLFSSGVNNKLILILQSGEVISTKFQRKYPDEMRNIRKELTYYYHSKKMTKENYLDTLNERIL